MIKSRLNKLVFGFLMGAFFITENVVLGQEYNFKQLTQNEGLNARSIFKIIQDKSGFIWLATDNGIIRYDGLNFKKYGAQQGFTQKGAFFIYIDKENIIWAISFNFKLFKFINGVFVEQFGIGMPCWMKEDNKGDLWIATRTSKLFRTRGGKVQDSIILNDLNGPVYDFLPLKNGGIIVSSRHQCVYVNEKKVTQIPIKDKGNHVIRLYQKSDGSILISNLEGIYTYSVASNSCKMVYENEGVECYCFYEDPLQGDLWVGHSNGILKFKNGEFKSKNTETYLSQKSVLSILSLPNNINWFGTLDYGLFSEHFQSYHITESNKLIHRNIKYVKHIGDSIFLFSNNGDIQLLYKKEIKPYRQIVPKKEIEFFYNVVQNENGEIYFTSKYEGKIYKVNHKGIEQVPQTMPKGLFPSHKKSVTNLFLQGGFCKLSKNKLENLSSLNFFHEVWKKHAENDPFFKPVLQQNDSDYLSLAGNGWVKTTLGKHEIRSKRYNEKNQISSLVQTAHGNLVESVLGLGIIFNKGSSQYVLKTEDGLLSNNVQQLFYHEPYLFASSIDGLAVITLDNNDKVIRINNLSKENYLKSNLVNDVLVLKNDVYIATVEGITILPKSTLNYQEKSRIFIDHISINSKDTVVRTDYVLPSTLNNLEIQFGCISYDGMRTVLYKYKLFGSDSNFTYSFANTVRYNALAPGEYEFIIFGKTLNGTWSTVPIRTQFVILAPFYKRPWFIGIVLALGFLILYFSIRTYVKSVRNRENLKGRLVYTELRALRLHMNPHFIFNTLNSLQSFVLQNKPLEANMYISKFSSLIRHILDDRRATEVVLADELKFLQTYIEIEQMRLKDSFKFELIVDPNLNPESLIIPSMIIQPFVENAIKYGLAPKEHSCSKLRLSFDLKDDNFIKVIVNDNGVGRNYGILRQTHEHSTGIEFTNERLKLILNSKIPFDPVLVKDLFDDEGKSLGTEVEIIIPILT